MVMKNAVNMTINMLVAKVNQDEREIEQIRRALAVLYKLAGDVCEGGSHI